VRMELRPLDVDDPAHVASYVEITNASQSVDAPWEHDTTLREAEGYLRHGWDGDLADWFLVEAGGEPVGIASYYTSAWDNPQLAWMGATIHPAHRRRGHASGVVEEMLGRARSEGRRTLGADGWESDGVLAFAQRHGFEVGSRAVVRRQVLADVDWAAVEALHKEAAGHATGYDLERLVGPSEPDVLAEIAEITAAINDAPTDDLDFDDEVFPPERVGRYERAQAARAHTLHRLVARHRDSGKLAGHTVVVVHEERPWIGGQHDTSVMRDHRGHRLGLYLKAGMLLWLRDAQPQLETIDTGNAASNDYMISINEQLGYRVMAEELEVQRRV